MQIDTIKSYKALFKHLVGRKEKEISLISVSKHLGNFHDDTY